MTQTTSSQFHHSTLCSPCSSELPTRSSSLRSHSAKSPYPPQPLAIVHQTFFTTTEIRAAILLDIHLASTAPNARLRKPTPAKEWPHSPLSLDTNQFIGRKFNFNGTMYTVVMIAPSDSFPPDLEILYPWGRPSNSTKIAGLSLWSGTSMLPITLKPQGGCSGW